MKSSKVAVVGAVVSLAVVLVVSGCDRSDTATVDSTTDAADENMQEEAKQMESSVSDAVVTTKVKSAIINDPDLKVLQIDVKTVGGVVTLTGTVDSMDISERANTVVSNVEGVKSVNNKLQVKTAG